MTNPNDRGATGSRHLYGIEYQQTGRARTPDIDQSVIDLYRSFSNGGIVAFVGSGASASLGHCSWKELAISLAGKVKRVIGNGKVGGEQEAIKKHVQMLEDAIIEREKDRLDTFELLSLTSNVLQTVIDMVDDNSAQIIKNAIEAHYKEQFEVKTSQKIDKTFLDSLNKSSTPYSNDVKAIVGLMEAIEEQELLVRTTGADENGNGAAELREKCRLTPVDYAAGIELIRVAIGKEEERPDKPQSVEEDEDHLLRCPLPSIDVLGVLRNEWKIGRYVTLNFDHEIERMLERGDYPFESLTRDRNGLETKKRPVRSKQTGLPQKGVQAAEQSRLGERARVVDLSRENSAELMLFAANCPAGTTQVLHLHGSKHCPEDMIITDSDYNRRYYANDAAAAVLNDGQELLFRANAIVFVGVGMQEDELLRASRILAQASGRESRPIYAFMAYEGDAKQQALRVKLFQRYGIHAVFYGTHLNNHANDEVGHHHRHPLVQAAAVRLAGDQGRSDNERREWVEAIAKNLQPISKERALLKDMRNRVKSARQPGEHQNLLEKVLQCFDDHETGRRDGKKEDLSRMKESMILQYPRLMLTPWHQAVFRLACRMAVGDAFTDSERQKAYLAAIDSLESAIMGRALADALKQLSAKAIEWKNRWQDAPVSRPATERNRKESSATEAPSWFRRMENPDLMFKRMFDRLLVEDSEFDSDPKLEYAYAHNVSRDHTSEDGKRSILERMLEDEKGIRQYEELHGKMASERHDAVSSIVVVNRNGGGGKGIVATKFASTECSGNPKTTRIVISFAASCSRDSMLDLIADIIIKSRRWSQKNGEERTIELVMSRFDLLFTLSELRPKLAEWQIFIDKLFAMTGIGFVLLCNGHEARKFLAGESEKVDGKTPERVRMREERTKDYPAPDSFRNEYGGDDPIERMMFAIAKKCGCVWAASFLNALYNEIVLKEDRNEAHERTAFFSGMMSKMSHALNLTQNPQQRTPAVLDVAISELENYIFTYRDYEARRNKVLAHAILKHLFAFGGPIAGTVLLSCPEIRRIFNSYNIKQSEERGEIAKAIRWLHGIDMISVLYDCFSAECGHADSMRDDGKTLKSRYSLHGHMRNYLAVKKGLPFSVVLGREQTAMTLLPIIDEEAVPLQQSDSEFIWDTFDDLLIADRGASEEIFAPESDNIRAAFMLLRGSMRIGTVLRARNAPDDDSEVQLTPLERCFRALLAIRHAVLAWSKKGATPVGSRPLYEREWIWLFNEMGVVKLLQGHVDDASAFFEQAAEFERDRIRRKSGYEWFSCHLRQYESAGQSQSDVWNKGPHFTIGLCRILLNLAISEVERGALNRAERLLRGRTIDFAKIEGALQQGPRDGSGAQMDHCQEQTSNRAPSSNEKPRAHRELRLLKLVCDLIGARVKFLSGGSGEAAQWLEENEKTIVMEGVPGLTSWYFLIRGDVELRRDNLGRADDFFKTARAEAEASGRSDLVLSTMIGESQRDLKRERYHSAGHIHYHLSRIHEIKQEAKRMGLARVLVTASMTRARLYLSLGEYRSARYDMMSAIALSNAYGLNIKRVACLITMAALVGSMGDGLREEAQDITEAARFEADRIGYQLAAMSATELDIVLREGGSIEDWAAGLIRSDAAHSGRKEWRD